MGICLVWPIRSINFLRHSLVPGSLTKIHELTNHIFDSFVTSPPSSPRNSFPSSSGNGRTKDLANTLEEMAIGVGLTEEDRGEDAAPLSEPHHIPPHLIDDSGSGTATKPNTALPIIRGTSVAAALSVGCAPCSHSHYNQW